MVTRGSSDKTLLLLRHCWTLAVGCFKLILQGNTKRHINHYTYGAYTIFQDQFHSLNSGSQGIICTKKNCNTKEITLIFYFCVTGDLTEHQNCWTWDEYCKLKSAFVIGKCELWFMKIVISELQTPTYCSGFILKFFCAHCTMMKRSTYILLAWGTRLCSTWILNWSSWVASNFPLNWDLLLKSRWSLSHVCTLYLLASQSPTGTLQAKCPLAAIIYSARKLTVPLVLLRTNLMPQTTRIYSQTTH